MASVQFKKGAEKNLPAAEDGQILFATDTGNLFIDNGTTHIQVNAKNAKTADLADKAEALKVEKAVGSATVPVFINAQGEPVAINYYIEANVPSNAKFTDTTYSAATTSKAGLMSAADKTKLNTHTHPVTVNASLSGSVSNRVLTLSVSVTATTSQPS